MVSLVNSRSERSWLVVCACPVNAGKLSGLQCSFVGWLGSDAKSWMGHRDWTSYDDRWVPPNDQRPSPPHRLATPGWQCGHGDTPTPPTNMLHQVGRRKASATWWSIWFRRGIKLTGNLKKKKKKQAEKRDRNCILKTLSCNYVLIFSHWNCTGNFADGE